MTATDQQAALLRAICQRPDDTQARLVFADWCEDNGQEARAEFVRAQVEFENWRSICANHDSQRSKCPGCVLRRRSHAIIHESVTYGHMNPKPKRGWLWAGERLQIMYPCAYTYRCGFVEDVECHSSEWLAHGPQIVAVTPVRTVRLTDCEPLRFTAPDSGSVSFDWPERFSWGLNGLLCKGNWCLPDEFWHLLPSADTRDAGYKRYDNRNAALDALSAAAVAWARRQAGLNHTAKEPLR